MDKLKAKTLKSLAWLGASKFIGQIISFVITIYVARILSPADYGLMGIASLVISFSLFFNELGFGAAIIQNKEIDQQILSGIFWFSLVASSLLALLIFYSAPLIGSFFNTADAVPLIQLLSICFFAGALKIVPYNLLTKELEFDKRSKADLVTTLLTCLITLLLAINGFGVYSLVYSYIFSQFFINLLIYYYHPWLPSLVFPWSKIRDAVWFGLRVTGTRIMWYFHSNSDFLVVGKILGEKMLGYYSMAFKLAHMPSEKISTTINEVSFPVLSKLKNESRQFNQYLLKISTYTALITFPIFTMGILLAEDLVVQILTEKWRLSIFPFTALCFVGAIQSVRAIVGQAFVALGEVSFIFKFSVVNVIIFLAAFYLGSFYGINGIALSWLCVYPLVSLFFMSYFFKIVNLNWVKYLKAIRTPITGCIIIVMAILLLKFFNPIQDKLIKLIVEITLCLLLYLVFVLIRPEGVVIKEYLNKFIKDKFGKKQNIVD
jgi:O-antigen/teichoic acid export membrane protein